MLGRKKHDPLSRVVGLGSFLDDAGRRSLRDYGAPVWKGPQIQSEGGL